MQHVVVIDEIRVVARETGHVMLDGPLDSVLVLGGSVALMLWNKTPPRNLVTAPYLKGIRDVYFESNVEFFHRSPQPQAIDQSVLSISAEDVSLAYKRPGSINMIYFDNACFALQIDEMLCSV